MNINCPSFCGSGIQCSLVRSSGSGSFTGCNLGISLGCGHSSQGSTWRICLLTHTLWLFLGLLRPAFKIIQINCFQFEIPRVVSVSIIKYNYTPCYALYIYISALWNFLSPITFIYLTSCSLQPKTNLRCPSLLRCSPQSDLLLWIHLSEHLNNWKYIAC